MHKTCISAPFRHGNSAWCIEGDPLVLHRSWVSVSAPNIQRMPSLLSLASFWLSRVLQSPSNKGMKSRVEDSMNWHKCQIRCVCILNFFAFVPVRSQILNAPILNVWVCTTNDYVEISYWLSDRTPRCIVGTSSEPLSTSTPWLCVSLQ